jgi:hypothetical protein
VNAEEIAMLFTEHIEFLLSLMNQTNNMNNIHVRSIAARCLTEVEICFPASIRTCSVLCLQMWSEEPLGGLCGLHLNLSHFCCHSIHTLVFTEGALNKLNHNLETQLNTKLHLVLAVAYPIPDLTHVPL